MNENKTLIVGDSDSSGELNHIGMPRRSGRYPFGSGDDPGQRTPDFLNKIDDFKKNGFSETPDDIKKFFNMSTTEYREKKANAVKERQNEKYNTVKSMNEHGLTNMEISRKTGIPEPTVRYILTNTRDIKVVDSVVDDLKNAVKEKGFIDVGAGVELEVGITRSKFNQALRELKDEGYPVYTRNVPQLGNPGQNTKVHVLCPIGTENKEIYGDLSKIKSYKDYTLSDVNEGETTRTGFTYPKSMDSKRLLVKFDENGGTEKDGLIELRRGVKDISLGDAKYSQVRILIDDSKYIKGMAVYKDDMPDGIDVIFNSNKPMAKGKLGALKDIKKDDPDNPFGSAIKEDGGQSWYFDDKGKKQLSLINKRADEGDWDDWKDKLPSQFLAKQNMHLINRQLGLAVQDKQQEYNEIMSVKIPTIRKALLTKFADKCDSDAVSLSAAALPRQKYHVILPENTLNDKEVYAPKYKNGEQVALIRYPHAGLFEIPIVTVNNNNKNAKQMIGNGADAIAINSKIASILSGADFDGDTVMVIPTNNKTKISSKQPLSDLVGFDPKREYPAVPGMVYMKDPKTKKDSTQSEMGAISNLITDMTIKGATPDEMTRAVKHSMVVIDAAKHELDYKQSEKDNRILELKNKYQGHYNENGNWSTGASTIMSSAKSVVRIPKTVGSPKIDSEGNVYYKEVKEYYTVGVRDEDGVWRPKLNSKGEPVVKLREQETTKMALAKDARTLVSNFRSPKELAYADYANTLKQMARNARLESVKTPTLKRSPDVAKQYANEVSSLKSKLTDSKMNAPRERQALIIANYNMKQKIQSNPDLNNNKDDLSKAKSRELFNARQKVNAHRKPIIFTDKEWEAIEKGAVSDTTLKAMIYHIDDSDLKQRSMPKSMTTLSDAQISKAKMMFASDNYTLAQIAQALGKSVTTISKIVK